MQSANKYLIFDCALFYIVLTASIILTGCTSKNNEDNEDQAVVSKTTSQKGAKSTAKELEILKKKNEELNTKNLELEKEVKRLRQQNENSIKAIADVIALIEKSKILNQENTEIKQAVNKLIALEKQNNKTIKPETDTINLTKQFETKVSTEEKLKFIESLSELASLQDLSVVSIVRIALDDPDPEIGRAAIELLEDYTIPEVLPVVEYALGLEDEQTRRDAVSILSNVNDPQIGALLSHALDDSSGNIRTDALKIAREKNDVIQLEVLTKGITATHKDVKFNSTWLLQERSDHKAMDIIIEGLKDPDPEFREEINETLNFLINREFGSYDEAKTWWEQNKNKYDKELFEKDDM